MIETELPVKRIATSPRIPFRRRVAEALEPFLPYIVLLWLVGVFGLSVWHLGGWTQLQRLRRKMVKPVDVSLRAKLDELAKRLGVKRAVQLTESALVRIPTVVGWLRPVILSLGKVEFLAFRPAFLGALQIIGFAIAVPLWGYMGAASVRFVVGILVGHAITLVYVLLVLRKIQPDALSPVEEQSVE